MYSSAVTRRTEYPELYLNEHDRHRLMYNGEYQILNNAALDDTGMTWPQVQPNISPESSQPTFNRGEVINQDKHEQPGQIFKDKEVASSREKVFKDKVVAPETDDTDIQTRTHTFKDEAVAFSHEKVFKDEVVAPETDDTDIQTRTHTFKDEAVALSHEKVFKDKADAPEKDDTDIQTQNVCESSDNDDENFGNHKDKVKKIPKGWIEVPEDHPYLKRDANGRPSRQPTQADAPGETTSFYLFKVVLYPQGI